MLLGISLPSASQLQASRVRVPFAAPVPLVLASDIKRKEWHRYDCMTWTVHTFSLDK